MSVVRRKSNFSRRSGIDIGHQTLCTNGVKPFAHVGHNRLIEFQRAKLGAALKRSLLGEFTIMGFNRAADVSEESPVGAILRYAAVENPKVFA